METMTKPDVIESTDLEVLEYLESCIGKEFDIKYSLEYPHGVMVKGKITHVQRGVETKGGFFEDKVVFFEATFSDGFKAEYATDAIPFYANYYDQL